MRKRINVSLTAITLRAPIFAMEALLTEANICAPPAILAFSKGTFAPIASIFFISSGIVKRPVDLDYVRFVSSMERNKNLNGTDAYDEEVIKAMPDGATHPFFFRNTGSGNFEELSKSWGMSALKGYYTGAAYADLDNDGDLDIVRFGQVRRG